MSENKNAKTPADGPTANRAMTLEEAQQWITTTWLRCQDEVWRQPEALRLADALDAEFVQGRISNSTGRESAVELRRLALKQWIGLTDEEINSVRHKRDWTAPWTDTTFARAIEAKLREKNMYDAAAAIRSRG
jgi:hypothetical protein